MCRYGGFSLLEARRVCTWGVDRRLSNGIVVGKRFVAPPTFDVNA
jgi:hypothetical protein